jgi:hypothetical protein
MCHRDEHLMQLLYVANLTPPLTRATSHPAAAAAAHAAAASHAGAWVSLR